MHSTECCQCEHGKSAKSFLTLLDTALASQALKQHFVHSPVHELLVEWIRQRSEGSIANLMELESETKSCKPNLSKTVFHEHGTVKPFRYTVTTRWSAGKGPRSKKQHNRLAGLDSVKPSKTKRSPVVCPPPAPAPPLDASCCMPWMPRARQCIARPRRSTKWGFSASNLPNWTFIAWRKNTKLQRSCVGTHLCWSPGVQQQGHCNRCVAQDLIQNAEASGMMWGTCVCSHTYTLSTKLNQFNSLPSATTSH